MLYRAIKIIILSLFLGSVVFSQPWSQISTTGSVPQLKNHSAIYNPISNRMVVFGGRTPAVISSEMWSLNLTTNQWTQIIPNGNSPSARYTQNAYFDSLGGRMIIWSGQGIGGVLYNDVWAYSFATNQWQQLWADGNVNGAPLKRYGTASVFNPATRSFTTFAGFTTSGRFEDTWSFNIDSLSWADKSNNPHPPKRCLHSSVFAYETGRFIIYAGQDTGPLDDIWQLNFVNYQWLNITPSFKPPARFWNSIIYTGGGNIVMFGGLSGSTAFSDMWKFSLANNQWESVNQGTVIPPSRWGHTAIYVPSQDRMIIFGGDGAASYNDTWQFTNVSVIGIHPITHNVPENFSLGQNYPNPFNPVTSFKFQVSSSSCVKLIVFDVLGRKVATLVNELLKAGTYEVDFDGSDLPSGVYYYRIEITGANQLALFTETKKMVLLK